MISVKDFRAEEDCIHGRDIGGLCDDVVKAGIEKGYQVAIESLYGDGFDEAGEFLEKIKKKALKGEE